MIMSHGGFFTVLPDNSIHPERRYSPSGGETPLFLPWQSVPQVAAKNRFRPISPLGKFSTEPSPKSSQKRQPIDAINPVYIQPPTRPAEGRLTARGFVDAYESTTGKRYQPVEETFTWSP